MGTTKQTQASKILSVLEENDYVTNLDLNKICFRYSARLHELRREGHNIQREYEKPGVWRYWLAGNEDAS